MQSNALSSTISPKYHITPLRRHTNTVDKPRYPNLLQYREETEWPPLQITHAL